MLTQAGPCWASGSPAVTVLEVWEVRHSGEVCSQQGPSPPSAASGSHVQPWLGPEHGSHTPRLSKCVCKPGEERVRREARHVSTPHFASRDELLLE